MKKELIKIFKDKKFLKEIAIILVFGLIINALCFCMPLVVHASGYESEYFPFDSGYNPNNYPIDDNYIKGLFSDPTVCMVKAYWENSLSHPDWYTIYVLHDSSVTLATPFFLYGEVYTSNPARFDVRSTSSISGIYVESYQYRDGSWSDLLYRWDNSFANFTNILGTKSDPMSIYYVKENLNKDTPSGLTLIYGNVKNSIYPGDFSDLPPLDDVLNNITNSFTSGSSGTQSSVDNSKTDIQNFIDAFNNLQNSITDNINNLGQNQKNWWDNLQKKLTDTTNAILGGIYDGFKTLNDNFKDFFGAKLDSILDKLDYIQEPFSSAELTDNLNNANFSSDFLSLTTSVSSFAAAFTSGTEPSTCSFTLDFSNSYYNFGVCEFSLDWILPFRPGIRLIIGCLCVYSLIVSIFTSLNTYIGGTSSINDDI